jgi:predicted nucleic acid-binding protein
MKIFFDTSVLVAASSVHHEHHEPSFSVYQRAPQNDAYWAAHSIAEVYAALTRLPGKERMSGEQALLVLDELREHLSTVVLDENEYHSAITEAAAQGVLGGTTYDALIAYCALKVKATIIYTWNVDHFRRCGPEVAKRVRTP